MPTTLPRVNVAFKRPTYALLAKLSQSEGASLSQVVATLVESSLELSEDIALAQAAERRLDTFRRDEALSTNDLLRWNKNRKTHR